MAFMECHFHSDVLGMACTMNVILPQASGSQIGMDSAARDGAFPCLYLLHGLSDDHSIWMRRTSIERYVSHLGLAVVMPGVHRSFYANMVKGYRYWDFVTEELPGVVQSMFRVSDRREDRFVAGLSMGGYGAFKMARGRRDLFSAGCSLSGALDIAYRQKQEDNGGFGEERRFVFGDPEDVPGSENDLRMLAEKAVADKGEAQFLYQWCGTEDFLYEDNRRFAEHCLKIGLDVLVEEGPGDHQWKYWDRQIVRFLDLLQERELLAAPGS